MPRRLPSFVPSLIFAVVLAHAAAFGQSVDAQLPPDVPGTRLALEELQAAAKAASPGAVRFTGGGELLDAELRSSPMSPAATDPFTVDSSAPLQLSPQLTAEDGDDGNVEQTFFPPESPIAATPSCTQQGGLLRRIGRLPLATCDWIFNPPPRHRNIGRPLVRESWRYRPFSLGPFVGYIRGGTLIEDWTGSSDAVLGGFRLGWDPGYYWGCEFRYAVARLGQWDSLSARQSMQAGDGPYDANRSVDMDLWDFSLLYYPWGDTAWRPYGLIGLGGSQLRFSDCTSQRYSQQAFAMPLAMGLKYRYNSRLALRFELADNIVFASGSMDTVHHFSATGGLELRFGGRRKVYWPWSPGRHYW